MADANNLTQKKYPMFLFLVFKNVFLTSLGKRRRVETLSIVSLGHKFLFLDTASVQTYPVNLALFESALQSGSFF